MSIFSAINNALSGMSGESNALTSISNNISNSSTVGYKEVNTDFQDLVLGGNATGAATLGGTQTIDRMNISGAGQITSTGVSTDLAVSGNGFMVVNTNANSGSGQYLVTQAGSFRPDANGNLVNAAGYFLQGVPLDAAGNPTTPGAGSTVDSLSTVNVSNMTVAAAPTTTMTFNANLPSGDTAYSTTPPTPQQTSVDYYDSLGNTHSLSSSSRR
jgi:flagellar hook protein FlgE